MTDETTPATAGHLGARLFNFVVIADTHVNQEEGKASSDFAVNRLANARNRNVVHEINRLAPAFVLHLGDIVHPTPIHPGYATAARAFHALVEDLACPLHLTPGNHDVGDKPGEWLPVPTVRAEFLAMYEEHFGAQYHAFDATGCHFVIINCQLINSGLAVEAAQKAWLEADLAAHHGQRIFLCSHYPPYLYERTEDSHYDNIDEPGRSWLLDLVRHHRVEAVFAGHVHNFWYHRDGDAEIYLLPSTAFVRLDYSELCRVEPGPERGRNDAPKLGFFHVEVYEHGHVAHAIRTWGATLGPDEAPDRGSVPLPAVHPKSIRHAPVGVDLRYAWAEPVEVAASGALDEFTRKLARNDYPLLALWEMGVRRLRVPLSDLGKPATLQRMRDLRRVGHEFTVYSHGVPRPAYAEILAAERGLVATCEIVIPLKQTAPLLPALHRLKAATGVSCVLSTLRRHDDEHHHGISKRHVIAHGFLPAEEDRLESFLRQDGARACFDGFLFRVGCDSAPWDEIAAIDRIASRLDVRNHAYVRLAAENPAVAMEDDLANANRIAEMMVATRAASATRAWVDTLNDVDRGYFPRSGLVDRRYNPRLAGRVFRGLQSVLGGESPGFADAVVTQVAGMRAITASSADQTRILLLPERAMSITELPVASGNTPGHVRWTDLAGAQTVVVACSPERGGSSPAVRLARPVWLTGPVLVALTA